MNSMLLGNLPVPDSTINLLVTDNLNTVEAHGRGFYCIASDIAVIRNCPVVEVILKEPENTFFLPDEKSKDIVDKCLYPCCAKQTDGRIKATLYSVFCQAFSSVEEGFKLKGMKEILYYTLAGSVGHHILPYTDDTLPTYESLFSAMEMVILKLKTVEQEQLSATGTSEFSTVISWARSMIDYSKKRKGFLDCVSLYQVLLCGWAVLKDMPCTYSVLASLVLLQDEFDDLAQTRYELFGLLKQSSFS